MGSPNSASKHLSTDIDEPPTEIVRAPDRMAPLLVSPNDHPLDKHENERRHGHPQKMVDHKGQNERPDISFAGYVLQSSQKASYVSRMRKPSFGYGTRVDDWVISSVMVDANRLLLEFSTKTVKPWQAINF
jgi:hypothetical protein